MALFGRKRESGRRGYVAPPEVRTGLVVLADRGSWHVLGLNAGAGRVPATAPGVAEPTPEALADGFRLSWQRAAEGIPAAGDLTAWVRAVRPGGTPAEAWRAFFLDGGAFFRVIARPAAGITAMRHCWSWPSAGGDLVPQSLKDGDVLTVAAGSEWRRLIEHEQEWRRAPMWATTARWLRDRAGIDPRASAWWVAGEDGLPGLPVATQHEAVDAVRAWWNGDWYATGSRFADRYGIPVAPDDGYWYAWLRWDPRREREGPATVLGFRRTPPVRDHVDLVWWDIDDDGRPLHGLRAHVPDGGRLTIDRAEQLAVWIVATERRPPDVDWREVGAPDDPDAR